MSDGSDRPPAGTRALVLGGSGFLGRHIADALRAAGMDVSITSRRPGGTAATLRLDLLLDDPRALKGEIARRRPDAIVNCVGRTGGSVPELVDGNTIALARLLEAVAGAAPRCRLVHLGSAGEYGTVPGRHAIPEEMPEAPVSPYGLTKLAGTRAALRLAADAGLDVVVLRVFNPIGPGSPVTSLPGRVAHQIRQALRRSPHPDIDTAPLDSYRDWIDVRDVGAAVLRALRVPEPASRLYNVGSGRAVSAREVVGLITQVSGFAAAVREDRSAPARSDSVLWQQADITRAARELGWRPRHSLADSIGELWRCAT